MLFVNRRRVPGPRADWHAAATWTDDRTCHRMGGTKQTEPDARRSGQGIVNLAEIHVSRMMWWTTPAPGIECAKGVIV